MKKRILGQNLEVSAVGLGCMGFSHASGAPTERSEAVKILRQAYDMGYTFFDTAECYTGTYPDGSISYNEELVGEALRDIRDKVVIATKCGVRHAPDHGLILDSRPETIRASVEGSLKKLGVEAIDLYYQHRIDPKVEPEAVADTMGQLIQEGKIRHWGISETTEEYLRRAHAVCPVTAVQNRYSLMARWHESLFPTLEELNVGFVAFSPMANGFLSGAYTAESKFEPGTDYRGNMPQYTAEGFEKSRALMELLDRLAKEHSATQAQVSMAWMICKKPYIVPIPGSRKPERLRENLKAGEIVLSEQEISAIDGAVGAMELPVFGGSPTK
ncbi:aldo/keto reductase [uncultured Neglectibacter sp.]|uniref:aldo/keto reductase n=1 Tax=uncultured Neglectibacter sp. TaxID=1924108 RepID=UPI0034DF9D63